MGKRIQRRTKGILPIKITVPASDAYLAHTVDISASGARAVLPAMLNPGAILTLEFKHKRATAVIAWCRPIEGRRCEYEIGLRLEKPGQAFWGVAFPGEEEDCYLATGTEGNVLRFARSDYLDKDW